MAKKIKYVGAEPVNKDSNSSFSVFNDSFQTTVFNGGLKLSTKTSTFENIRGESRIIVTQKNVTLTDLKINDLKSLNEFIKVTNKLKLNVDKENLSTYAVYGSLKEKYRIAVNNILSKFIGGIYMNTFVNGIPYNTLLDYTYDEIAVKSSFKVPITVIENPYLINLSTFDAVGSNDISNVVTRYQDYVLTYNNKDYKVKEFTGFSIGNSSYLYFVVDGNPFSGNSTPQNISYDFLIKPNDIEFNKFYTSLNELERYFLNKDSNPKYRFVFRIPIINDDGELDFNDYTFNFPVRYDGYNLDNETITYTIFLEKLFEVGDIYDEYKSNLIIRKFIPKTLIDLDTTDSFKSESMFKIYGKEIDEIKLFIDSLMYINNTSYDKINNIPDSLIKNLARTLSWKTRNIINDKDLLSTVFANDKTSDNNIRTSLAEVDIEFWRRLVINTAWFLKSKGTRKSIETIFNFIGAPESLVSLDEYVYVIDAPLTVLNDVSSFVNNQGFTIPLPRAYDDDGYPIAPLPNRNVYFHLNGIEDGGKQYIDFYRKLGYKVTKVLDNKKSWVYYESANTHSSIGRGTNYEVNDSRLIINTKEISMSLDIARAIEYDVYEFNKEYNYPVSNTGRTFPYPQRDSNNIQTSGLTFIEYVEKVYSSFINVQNRKVSDSAIGSYYPSLTKLYYDYLYESFNDIGVQSNKRKFKELLKYVDNFDDIFNEFLKKFVPATSIIENEGTKIRNTIFTPQKFVYKQGIDDGSEFKTNVVEPPLDQRNVITIRTELFQNYEDTLAVATISTDVVSSNDGNINTDTFASVKNSKNIQTPWGGSICNVEAPTFSLTGGTKIELSSLTNNQIFNKTTGASHNVIFNFTSATEVLSANTTEFVFNVHKYNSSSIVLGFDDTPIYTFSASPTSFTTSSTISINIPTSFLSCDSEYIIKPYFNFTACSQSGQIFTATTPYTIYEDFLYNTYYNTYFESVRFFDYTKFKLASSSTFTSLLAKNEYTPSFRNYNSKSDYYFVSNCIPDVPVVELPVVTEDDGLIVESFTVNTFEYQQLVLSYAPIGDVIVAVNGITLYKGIEYNFATIGPESIRVRTINLTQRLTSEHNDVVTVSYYKNPNSTNRLIKEDFTYTGSTNIVYNNTTQKYEVNLTYNRVLNTDYLVYLNGILLTEGTDYTFSITNRSKVVLNDELVNLNIINVVYFTTYGGNGVINATGPNYTINWSIPNSIPSNVNGKFVHEFYDINDTGFTGNTIYTVDSNYIVNTNNFSQSFNWLDLTPSPLVLGFSYLYRIKSQKNFKTINNIDLSSVTYSNTYTFTLPN